MSIELSSIVKPIDDRAIVIGTKNRSVFWGSSSTFASFDTPNNILRWTQTGYVSWAQMLFGSKLCIQKSYATAGAHTDSIVANLAANFADAGEFDIAILQLGANDVDSVGGFATCKPYLESTVKYLVQRGVKIINVIPHRKRDAAIVDYELYKSFCNTLELKYGHNVFRNADHYTAIENADNPTQYFKDDQVHLNEKGSIFVARTWQAPLHAFCGDFDIYPFANGVCVNDETFVTTLSQVGGWSFGASNVDSNGRLYIDASLVATVANPYVYKTITTGVTSGKKYRAVAKASLLSGGKAPSFYCRSNDFTVHTASSSDSENTEIMDAGDVFTWISPVITANANFATDCRIGMYMHGMAGLSASVRLHYMALVCVDDSL